jgi:hypothetical protein
MSLSESVVEDAALTWFRELGCAVGHGPHLAPREPATERNSFDDVVLAGRFSRSDPAAERGYSGGGRAPAQKSA